MKWFFPPKIKRGIPRPRTLFRFLPLPDAKGRRGRRTRARAPAFCRQAGPHPEGPDDI